MTHEALVNTAAATHAAVLVAALAFIRLGGRTDVIAESLPGMEDSIRALRRRIAGELADTLQADLTQSTTLATLVVEPLTESWVERPTDLFAGERYRDSIRAFVETNLNRMVDSRSLVTLRDAWIRWGRRMRWLLLSFVGYEMVVAGVLASVDRTGLFAFPDAVIRWAFVPTAVGVAVIGLHQACMERFQDRITDIRQRYADLSD